MAEEPEPEAPVAAGVMQSSHRLRSTFPCLRDVPGEAHCQALLLTPQVVAPLLHAFSKLQGERRLVEMSSWDNIRQV